MKGYILRARHSNWQIPEDIVKFFKKNKKYFLILPFGKGGEFADQRNLLFKFRKAFPPEKEEELLKKLRSILQKLENTPYPYDLLQGEIVGERVEIYSPWNHVWWGSTFIYKIKE